MEQTLQPDKELALIALKLGKGKGLWFPYIQNASGSCLGYNSNYQFANLWERSWNELRNLSMYDATDDSTYLITSTEAFITTRLYGQMIKYYCVVGGWISRKWYDYPQPFEAPCQ